MTYVLTATDLSIIDHTTAHIKADDAPRYVKSHQKILDAETIRYKRTLGDIRRIERAIEMRLEAIRRLDAIVAAAP